MRNFVEIGLFFITQLIKRPFYTEIVFPNGQDEKHDHYLQEADDTSEIGKEVKPAVH